MLVQRQPSGACEMPAAGACYSRSRDTISAADTIISPVPPGMASWLDRFSVCKPSFPALTLTLKFHYKWLFINIAYESGETTLSPYIHMVSYLSGLRSSLLNMGYSHSSKSVCSLSWSFYSLNGTYHCTRKWAGSVHE